jgi:sterol desaturase/sphingolipid hydroxylase (fatty acid hydroxylase superfamily)
VSGDVRDEELVGRALALLDDDRESDLERVADQAVDTIWRRFELERAPRRRRAARLLRWLTWIQAGIAAAALTAAAAGWVLLGGVERWLAPAGAQALSPAPVIALLFFAALATALGLSFGRWLEG